MKINHITQVGSVSLATLLGIFVNSCAPHGTGFVNPVNLPKIQGGAVAPTGLAGKTLKLVSSGGEMTAIPFKDPKYAPIVFNGETHTATYNKDQRDKSNAWVDIGRKGDDASYVLSMKFSTFQQGTYKIEKVTCSDMSEPWPVIEKGAFSLQ